MTGFGHRTPVGFHFAFEPAKRVVNVVLADLVGRERRRAVVSLTGSTTVGAGSRFANGGGSSAMYLSFSVVVQPASPTKAAASISPNSFFIACLPEYWAVAGAIDRPWPAGRRGRVPGPHGRRRVPTVGRSVA